MTTRPSKLDLARGGAFVLLATAAGLAAGPLHADLAAALLGIAALGLVLLIAAPAVMAPLGLYFARWLDPIADRLVAAGAALAYWLVIVPRRWRTGRGRDRAAPSYWIDATDNRTPS